MAWRWFIGHSANVRSWVGIIVGLYTVYIGYQMIRRKRTDSQIKLTGGELTIAVVLMATICFVLVFGA